MDSTPAALIPSKGEAIELLRLFDDCIDLSEPDSQGWEIFATLTGVWEDFEDNVARSVISFFVRKYGMETLDNYYEPPIRDILWMSVIMMLDVKSAQLFLEFDPQTHSVDNPFPSDIMSLPLTFNIVWELHVTTDILRYLIDEGANIHHVHDGQTPTSMSLYLSFVFLAWRDRLWATYQNLDEFVMSENPTTVILKRSGWHPNTLRIIFSLSFDEARTYTQKSIRRFFRNLRCERHHCSWIEPWWETLKYRVKAHQCISSMLEEAGMYLDKKYFGELFSVSTACCGGEDVHIMPEISSHEQLGHLSRVVHDFYRRGGKWRFHYRPGEVWCRDCLMEQESLEESSDTESLDEDADMEISDNEEEEEDDDASDISLG